MKFIFLTQYFPPETGAPQNRLMSLAKNIIGQGHQLEVLTAMPNYPKNEIFEGYRGKKRLVEKIEGVKVHRSNIYVTKKPGVISRLKNYFSFVRSSIREARNMGDCDFVLVESPPLFLSWSAYAIAKKKKAKVIFNVSDLWPESAEKLDIVNNRFLLDMAYRLEANSYKKAHLVSGQTQGIVESIHKRFPEVPVHWTPNGVDADTYASIEKDESWKTPLGLEGKKVFMYAGIVGHAQHLDTLIEAAEQLSNRKDVSVVIIGDGPEKDRLMQLNERKSAGVVFLPNTPKLELLAMLASCYGYIVPLKKLDLFKGAIPSKTFDPLAFGIPICLGVEGEAKEIFIDQGKSGLFFEPENAKELAGQIARLSDDVELRNQLGSQGKKFVLENFDRKEIAKKFIDKVQALM